MARHYLVWLFPFVLYVTTASNCPDPSLPEWKTKDLNCTQQDSTKRYHCQYNAETNLMVDFCAVPVNCTPGNHTQLDQSTKIVSCIPCSPDMYQSSAKPSYMFTQPNCDNRKTHCLKDQGELQCGEATSSQDYQCKCDYTQGYRPNSITSECDCFFKDSTICACQLAECEAGEVLAANFSCIPHVSSKTELSGPAPIVVIVGAVIGGIALIAIVIAVIYFVVVWRRKKHTLPKDHEEHGERSVPLIKVPEENESKGVSPESQPTEGGDKEPEKPGLLSEASPETPLMPAEGEEKVPVRPEDNLYNKVKVMFVESVNPNDLVFRVNLNTNEEERITEHTKREGREAGAGQLLQTVKRIYPDDWFERITRALKEPNVGLEHLAEKMEQIKQDN